MTSYTRTTPAVARQGLLTGRTKRRLQENLLAYLFISPATLITLTFGLLPVLYAVYVSLHKWRVKKGAFLGFRHYLRALGEPRGFAIFILGLLLLLLAWWVWRRATQAASDRRLIFGLITAIFLMAAGWAVWTGFPVMLETGDIRLFRAISVTVFYSVGTVPVQLALALVLAYLLFQNVRGQDFYRMIYFMTYVTPVVASAAVFRGIVFTPRDEGLANLFLSAIGLPTMKWLYEPKGVNLVLTNLAGLEIPSWLGGPSLALVSVMLYNIWVFVGYDAVIFLAGLGNIPAELYEAAKIDGAGRWALFRHITLPLLSPTTFFLSMVAVIGTFKAFTHIYVMRTPGAQRTVDTVSIYIFDNFFKATRYGYASALAFILFAIILSLTLIQNRVIGERVFYG
ncbi:MAG TPA: sugar ABC transporter permease [Chloroflexi bacterium]|nr:sugar ABC transporter permease [Chloroflexota bacterium]